ncbi:unannotated protein [freshwater metagenome]|uniref:Unannotated protein n=1 Tax=freshwater metagenome TaxID=449393 RepID=A0A6J7IAX3_9ZZZZ|nr:30S ribosomal protein S17 [Actinomycetota bacterium]
MSDETTDNQDPIEEAPVQEAPVEEAPVAEAEAPAEEPQPEEPQAEEAPETEAAADDAEAQASDEPEAEPAEPEEQLHPKEARRRSRSVHSGEARTTRTPEERQQEREAARRAAATARSRRRGQEREKAKAAGPKEGTPRAEHEPGSPQVRQGIVVSAKADKTLTVRVDYAKRHPRYQKIVRTSKTLHAHDERNDAQAGDTVRIIECRPMSRLKRWRLVEILERAK